MMCFCSAGTFSGLSGLGDLTVTCFSRLSRNRDFGEKVGRGVHQIDKGPLDVRIAELAGEIGVPGQSCIHDRLVLLLHTGPDIYDLERHPSIARRALIENSPKAAYPVGFASAHKSLQAWHQTSRLSCGTDDVFGAQFQLGSLEQPGLEPVRRRHRVRTVISFVRSPS